MRVAFIENDLGLRGHFPEVFRQRLLAGLDDFGPSVAEVAVTVEAVAIAVSVIAGIGVAPVAETVPAEAVAAAAEVTSVISTVISTQIAAVEAAPVVGEEAGVEIGAVCRGDGVLARVVAQFCEQWETALVVPRQHQHAGLAESSAVACTDDRQRLGIISVSAGHCRIAFGICQADFACTLRLAFIHTFEPLRLRRAGCPRGVRILRRRVVHRPRRGERRGDAARHRHQP